MPEPARPLTRPLEPVVARCPGDRVDAIQLEELGQLRYLDVLVAHVEDSLPRVLEPERRELGPHAAAKEWRRHVPHVKSVALPHQLTSELREPELPGIGIEAEDRACDRPSQVVPVLELVERAAEMALTGRREGIVGEEDLAHTGKVDV